MTKKISKKKKPKQLDLFGWAFALIMFTCAVMPVPSYANQYTMACTGVHNGEYVTCFDSCAVKSPEDCQCLQCTENCNPGAGIVSTVMPGETVTDGLVNNSVCSYQIPNTPPGSICNWFVAASYDTVTSEPQCVGGSVVLPSCVPGSYSNQCNCWAEMEWSCPFTIQHSFCDNFVSHHIIAVYKRCFPIDGNPPPTPPPAYPVCPACSINDPNNLYQCIGDGTGRYINDSQPINWQLVNGELKFNYPGHSSGAFCEIAQSNSPYGYHDFESPPSSWSPDFDCVEEWSCYMWCDGGQDSGCDYYSYWGYADLKFGGAGSTPSGSGQNLQQNVIRSGAISRGVGIYEKRDN